MQTSADEPGLNPGAMAPWIKNGWGYIFRHLYIYVRTSVHIFRYMHIYIDDFRCILFKSTFIFCSTAGEGRQ